MRIIHRQIFGLQGILGLMLFFSPSAAKAGDPLADINGPQFDHFNSITKLTRASWTALFVNLYAQRVHSGDDQFGPDRTQERSTGLMNTMESFWAPPSGANGVEFGNGLQLFAATSRGHDTCTFVRGPVSCLKTFVSFDASDQDLISRCDIDAYKTISQTRFEGEMDIAAFLKEEEAQYNDVSADLAAAVKNHDAQVRDSKQKELEDIRRVALGARQRMAGEYVARYKDLQPNSNEEGCSKINHLLAIGVLDRTSYDALGLSRILMSELYKQGLVIEFTAELSLLGAKVEKDRGAAALLADPAIKEFRRQQLELYADYTLKRIGKASGLSRNWLSVLLSPDRAAMSKDAAETFNPGGFLSAVGVDTLVDPATTARYLKWAKDHPDLNPSTRVLIFGSLDSELLFLLQQFRKDYPGDSSQFRLIGDEAPLSLDALASQERDRVASYEAQIASTNAIIRQYPTRWVDDGNGHGAMQRNYSGGEGAMP